MNAAYRGFSSRAVRMMQSNLKIFNFDQAIVHRQWGIDHRCNKQTKEQTERKHVVPQRIARDTG